MAKYVDQWGRESDSGYVAIDKNVSFTTPCIFVLSHQTSAISRQLTTAAIVDFCISKINFALAVIL